MAAADYYGQYNPYDGLGRDNTIRTQAHRNDAPLPPVPTSSPRPPKPHLDTSGHITPVPSPFEDSHYPPPSSRSDNPFGDTSYHGSQQSLHKPYSDPFGDNNAIPLQSKKPGMYGSGGSPTHGAPDTENQFLRQDSDPRRRRRQRPKGPWYKQKIAWFVWFMTTIQVIIFIVEIIRNGTFLGHETSISTANMFSSISHSLAHRNSSPIQPHDWSFSLRSHQHGSSLRPLHA